MLEMWRRNGPDNGEHDVKETSSQSMYKEGCMTFHRFRIVQRDSEHVHVSVSSWGAKIWVHNGLLVFTPEEWDTFSSSIRNNARFEFVGDLPDKEEDPYQRMEDLEARREQIRSGLALMSRGVDNAYD